MNKYQINIYWSGQDGAYIANVPELPGCMADGETAMEALRNAEVVIGEWIETARELGRFTPVPASEFAAERYVALDEKRVLRASRAAPG
jgi:predicted RNase H-like HicB family nuclease